MPPQFAQSVNEKQTLSYLAHHFQTLKNLANKMGNQNKSNTEPINLQIIRQQILQSVDLMEKKLCFHWENKTQLQFQDYITQFYEEEINKLREELNKSTIKTSKLQQKLRQQRTSQALKQFPSNQIYENSISVIEQRHLSIKLKKQLSHCQSLIEQNQQFICEQNIVIKQLTQQINAVELRQHSNRHKYEQSVLKYEQKTKQIGDKFRENIKEFSQNRKVYEKQFKQLEIGSARVNQQKTMLQEELLLKSEEITLLSKRVYDLELCLAKYERELQGRKNQTYQSNQAMIMLDKEVKVWKSKYQQGQNKTKSKLQLVLQDKKLIQSKKIQIQREVEQLKHKINEHYKVNQVNSQKREKTLKQSLRQKQQHILQLQRQINQLQSKLNTSISNFKRYQKQLAQMTTHNKQLTQQIEQLEDRLKQGHTVNQQIISKNNDEKTKMKKQIYQEVQQLLKINEETVRRIKLQETKIKEMSSQMQQKDQKIHALLKMIEKVEVLNSEIIKRNQISMKQLQQFREIKSDLQQKLSQSQKDLQEALKYRLICKQQQRHVKQIQKQVEQQTSSGQQLRNQIKVLQNRISNTSLESLNKQSLQQQISLLKQQHHKKDFLIKQLQSKISLLQEELRDSSEVAQIQRDRMKTKVKQLEELVKERYDFSNRPSNCG